MATSNSPTVVPSAPVMRCSSSWMMRSGGRSRPTGCTAAAGRPSLAGCLLPSLMSQCGSPGGRSRAGRSAGERSRTGRGLALAGQARELVDRGDDERRREPVDLLVHGQDGQPLVDRPPSENGHPAQLVAAVDVDAAAGLRRRTSRASIGVPHHGQRWICSTVSR